MNKPNGRVRQARDSDLPIIESWLPEPDQGDTLAVNWGLTKRVYKEQGMLVWEDGTSQEPVAYCWGTLNSTNSILEIQPEMKRKGIGRAFVEHLLEQSRANGEPLLEIEAAPPSSEAFWVSMGFVFAGDAEGRRIGRRILRLPQLLPDGPRVQVKVSFCNEAALYADAQRHPLLAEYVLVGAPDASGALVLSEKVACFDLVAGKDLVVRVEVDERTVYFDKAKYPEGKLLGITRCENGFSISAITVPTP